MTHPFRVERLHKQKREGFDCGEQSLSDYLCRQASQDQRRRFAVCYLLIDQSSDAVAGYYTLSASDVSVAELPVDRRKHLPRYPTVPIARIGRLAVSTLYQGQGLGSVLLFDAVQRSAASEIGVFAVAVDAIDSNAVKFYEHHGFMAFQSNPNILFLPISDALRQHVAPNTQH
ncbi:MAG: GNAT family N-acetyltransferase [Planctomycetota bacterium]